MDNLNFYFGEVVNKLLASNKENRDKIINVLNNLEKSDGWQVLKMVMDSAREMIIQNLKKTPSDLEVLITHRESLIAIDFLRNLPVELINLLKLSEDLISSQEEL